MVKGKSGEQVMAKALAPGLKTMLLTSVGAESETAVILEAEKVATSDAPLGTVLGLQLVAVFQSLLAGFPFHVALPAWAV
jgi:hypothetical protein